MPSNVDDALVWRFFSLSVEIFSAATAAALATPLACVECGRGPGGCLRADAGISCEWEDETYAKLATVCGALGGVFLGIWALEL